MTFSFGYFLAALFESFFVPFGRLKAFRGTSEVIPKQFHRGKFFPEPLIAIWEPKSYPVLLSFLSQGYSCPRKALINSESTILKPQNADSLMNVNTQEEFARAKELLEKKENVNLPV
jgi:molybdopterin-guanine dinucleotide biosynthesis protein A